MIECKNIDASKLFEVRVEEDESAQEESIHIKCIIKEVDSRELCFLWSPL